MRFASQLMCFPVGARSQSETPAGRHTDAMGDGKGALGSGAGGRHPQPAPCSAPPKRGFPGGADGFSGALGLVPPGACPGEALAEDSGETWG